MRPKYKKLFSSILPALIVGCLIFSAYLIKLFYSSSKEDLEISQERPIAAGPEQIYESVFPLFVEGGWQEPEKSLNRDLTPQGFFDEFSSENSSHLNHILAQNRKEVMEVAKAENLDNQINQETQENQHEFVETPIYKELPPEFKNSLLFFGFSSPNVDENFYKAYLRISLAAKKVYENEWLAIEYSLDNGASWKKLGKINILDEISNQKNDGYFSFPLPSVKSWQDLNNLKIKVTYKNSSDIIDDRVSVYLDCLWLEILRSDQIQANSEKDKSTIEEKIQDFWQKVKNNILKWQKK
jgi:hypothetical protein